MSGLLETAKTTLADAGNGVNVTSYFREAPLYYYETVTSTDNMASVPRFGHSSDFTMLFVTDDNGQAQEDYLKGLLFVGIFVLVVFGTWSLLLIGLKLWGLCSRIPGFLSGRPFTLETFSDEEYTDKEQLDKFGTRCTRKRAVFMVSGFLLVIFAILLVTNGFKQVEETRNTADVSLDNVRLLVDEATVLAQDLRDVGTAAIDLRDDLLIELEKERLCPGNPNYIVEDEVASAINDNAGAAIDLLSALGEFSTNEIAQLETGLATTDNIIDQVDKNIQAVAENEWIGVTFILPLVCLTSVLMAGTMAAYWRLMSPCYQFVLTWVVQPLFISWIVISYVFCGALALSASANADFCAGPYHQGGPDQTILSSIQRAGLEDTSIEFEIARFYLLQCTKDAYVDPFLFLRQHEAELTNAKAIVEELRGSIAKVNVETLSFECGRDFEPLTSSLDTVRAILDALEQAAAKGLHLLSCDRIVPIYADVVYDGTCNHSVTGLTWMFSSLLVISTMGMIMIMLRSSYKSDVIWGSTEPTDEDSEFYSMHRMANHNSKDEPGTSDEYDGYDGDVNDGPDGHDLQMHELDRQRTTDSGSVYTDGNGELHVMEVDPSTLPAFRKSSSSGSPKLYELEENSYDSSGNIKPSAPDGRYYDDDYLRA